MISLPLNITRQYDIHQLVFSQAKRDKCSKPINCTAYCIRILFLLFLIIIIFISIRTAVVWNLYTAWENTLPSCCRRVNEKIVRFSRELYIIYTARACIYVCVWRVRLCVCVCRCSKRVQTLSYWNPFVPRVYVTTDVYNMLMGVGKLMAYEWFITTIDTERVDRETRLPRVHNVLVKHALRTYV